VRVRCGRRWNRVKMSRPRIGLPPDRRGSSNHSGMPDAALLPITKRADCHPVLYLEPFDWRHALLAVGAMLRVGLPIPAVLDHDGARGSSCSTSATSPDALGIDPRTRGPLPRGLEQLARLQREADRAPRTAACSRSPTSRRSGATLPAALRRGSGAAAHGRGLATTRPSIGSRRR
jgi:hypothetical protein